MNSSKPIDTINFYSYYPGSGKDTIQADIADYVRKNSEKDVAQFGVGDIVRWHIKNNTELGIKAKSIPASQLLPDEIIEEMISEYLPTLDQDKLWLINGLPRNREQIPFYQRIINQYRRTVANFFLHVTREEADRRMANRNSRETDRYPAERAKRFDEAEQTMGPVIDFIKTPEAGIFVPIDAMRPIGEVTERSRAKVQDLGIVDFTFAQ